MLCAVHLKCGKCTEQGQVSRIPDLLRATTGTCDARIRNKSHVRVAPVSAQDFPDSRK